MRPWIEWSAGIGLAAACVMFTGCGGDGVPDPGSDSAAAADSAPDTGEPPAPAPPAAPAGSGKAAPSVAQNKSQAPSAPKEDADADDKKDAAQASGENSPAAKSEGGSATAEMLAMATGGQTGSGSSQPPTGGEAAPGQTPQPGGGAQAPGPPGGMGGYAEAMRAQAGGQANQAGAMGPYAEQMRAQAVAQAMRANQANQANAQANQAGAMAESMRARAGGGGQGGYPAGYTPAGSAGGSAGAGAQGPGGLAQDNGPADTRSPQGAVRAFLNALQAKDRDRLAEATALRSQTEASTEKMKELFGKIVDMSISDAKIDDLAKKLQGFQVAGENAVKSTGRLGIYLDKPTDEGSVLRFTLTVRKEKKGWGVMDMSSKPIEFKPMGNMNPRRKASGRG